MRQGDRAIRRFDGQVFEAAQRYHDASKRLLEPRPSLNGQPSVLVHPALHCAIIACELYLKSVDALPEWRALGDRSGDLLKAVSKKGKGHDGLLDNPQSYPAKRLLGRLKPEEIELLNSLKGPLMSSRYPYEPSSERTEPDVYVKLADRLEREIKVILRPDHRGNVRIG